VAGSVLLAWALAKGQRPTWAQVRASVVIGFFFFLLGHGSLHWAEQYVPSGLASLLIAIEPHHRFPDVLGGGRASGA